MSCKVDSVGFCSCPPLPLAYLSSKWRLMHAKRGILYERIFKMQRFSKSGEFFFGWKKQQQPFMYILTSQLEQVEKEFIAFYALKWIDKRPPLRQFQIHSHYTKKIRASTVQVQFFSQLKSILGLSSIFLLPNVLRTWYVSGPELIFLECIFVQPTTHPHVGFFLLGLATLKSTLKISK